MDELHRPRSEAQLRAALVEEYPEALLLSAHDPADVSRMRDWIVSWFERDMPEVELFVPWARGALVGEIHARVRVVVREGRDRERVL